MVATQNPVLIGIDLGGTKVAAGRIEGGKVVERDQKKIDATSKDPLDTVEVVSELIRQLNSNKVSAIGMGIPGLVDRERGIAYDVLNIPSWKEVPLKAILEKEFNIPLFLDNDSNCFAMGEYSYGAFAGNRDFVGITLGTGMGGGIIKNGTLMPDAHSCSGEFGNIPYLDGIYEHYCSGMFFQKKFDSSGEAVANAAGHGEKWAIEAYKEFGHHLGNAIKTIKLAVDPTMILIGGSVARASSLFNEAMWKSISEFSFPSALKGFQVNFSTTDHIAILGAAALCLDSDQTLAI